jgi:Na+/H+ antiporter NhaD/arsenite permease-like protein
MTSENENTSLLYKQEEDLHSSESINYPTVSYHTNSPITTHVEEERDDKQKNKEIHSQMDEMSLENGANNEQQETKRTLLQKGLRLNKIVIIFIVFLIAIISFAMVEEREEDDTKYFAVSTVEHVFIELDARDQPLNYIQVDVEPLELKHHSVIHSSAGIHDKSLNYEMINAEYDSQYVADLFQVTIVYEARDNHSTSFVPIANTTLLLQNIHQNNVSTTESYIFATPSEYLGWDSYRLLFYSNKERPNAIKAKITQHSRLYAARIPIAVFVLVFAYSLIIFELVHRTISTLLGSFLAIAALSILNLRPSLHTIIAWVEFHTLILLFGMMVIVAVMATTGFFEWIGVKAYKVSGNNVWRLFVIMCVFVAITSSMLDNVTSMLLLTPVIIRLCKVFDMSPLPLLISTVVVSNIGGCATAVGDPPVTIIVNTPAIRDAGIGFNEILFFMAPGTAIIVVLSLIMIRVMYRKEFSSKNQHATVPPEVIRLKNEIEIWKNTESRLSKHVNDEKILKDKLQVYILELEAQLQEKQAENSVVNIKDLEREYRIRNKPKFIVCAVVLLLVVFMFFLEAFISSWVHLSLDSIAIIGALMVVTLTDVQDFDHILEKVEWSSLLFFGTLFIMMGALDSLGLIKFIANVVVDLIYKVQESYRLAIAITAIMWLSSIVSAIVDSIPYTTAMIPVVLSIKDELNLPLKPLVFSLAFGSGLGGNGTLIASTANLVVAGISEKFGYPITFVQFMKTGLPIMLMSTFVANVYLLIVHCLFGLGLN